MNQAPTPDESNPYSPFYGIPMLPSGVRNDSVTTLIAFILVLFTAFMPENIVDIYLE